MRALAKTNSPVAQLMSTSTPPFLSMTGAKYSFANSNSLSAPGKPAAANPCLHPRSYANDTDGDVNRSLMGTYSTPDDPPLEFVTFAMIDRRGGGTKARRDERMGDVVVFAPPTTSSFPTDAEAGSSRLT